jgi:hypothetical protein
MESTLKKSLLPEDDKWSNFVVSLQQAFDELPREEQMGLHKDAVTEMYAALWMLETAEVALDNKRDDLVREALHRAFYRLAEGMALLGHIQPRYRQMYAKD